MRRGNHSVSIQYQFNFIPKHVESFFKLLRPTRLGNRLRTCTDMVQRGLRSLHKCMGNCPGGQPGTCAAGLEGRTCAACPGAQVWTFGGKNMAKHTKRKRTIFPRKKNKLNIQYIQYSFNVPSGTKFGLGGLAKKGELHAPRNGEACGECRPETSVLWLFGALGALGIVLCSYYFVRLGSVQ